MKYLFYKFFKMFVSERETETETETETERQTESEAGSRLWAVSTQPNAELKLTNWEIVTWAEVRGLTNWATQALL